MALFPSGTLSRSYAVAHNVAPLQGQGQSCASPARAALAPKHGGGHDVALRSGRFQSRRTTMGPLAQAQAVATTQDYELSEVEEEFDFPVESPASWSSAQRALVDRTVDLEGLHPSPARRAELVEQVRAASETSGVFYVKNLGVDMGLVHELRRQAKRFFAQPLEEKAMTLLATSDGDQRTYGYNTDFGISINREVPAPRFREIYRQRMFPEENRVETAWPSAQPSFKAKVVQVGVQVEAAANFMAGLLAEGLGLPASYIADTYGPLHSNLVMAHMLPADPAEAPGLPTHSDTNLLDFNISDGVRGVEFYVDGDWLVSPALLDSILFNLGDDFETVSNGRYHAVYHRVVQGSRSRVSMLTNCQFRGDTMIAPAAQLTDAQNPPRYRTRRQGERTETLLRTYHHKLKNDRTKAPLFLHADQHLDRTKNTYYQGDQLYINGVPVLA